MATSNFWRLRKSVAIRVFRIVATMEELAPAGSKGLLRALYAGPESRPLRGLAAGSAR